MRYEIRYQEEVVVRHIPELPTSMKLLIKRAIEERLTVDPIGLGKPLRYSLKGHRRLRVGDYRVVYKIDVQASTVLVVAIKHRKDVYE
ncbi:MAG: type II toxin-antitoxin system RelE/ParE family toxin [Myxococcaceae bacterium]